MASILRNLIGIIDRRPPEVKEVENKFERVVSEGERDIRQLRYRYGADATQVLIAERMFYDLMRLRKDFALMERLKTPNYPPEQIRNLRRYIKTKEDAIKSELNALKEDCKIAIGFVEMTIRYLKIIRKSGASIMGFNIHPRLMDAGKVLDFKARLKIFLEQFLRDIESLESSMDRLEKR